MLEQLGRERDHEVRAVARLLLLHLGRERDHARRGVRDLELAHDRRAVRRDDRLLEVVDHQLVLQRARARARESEREGLRRRACVRERARARERARTGVRADGARAHARRAGSTARRRTMPFGPIDECTIRPSCFAASMFFETASSTPSCVGVPLLEQAADALGLVELHALRHLEYGARGCAIGEMGQIAQRLLEARAPTDLSPAEQSV